MALHNMIGRIGEDAAAEMLRKKGWTIRERNWRLGHLEMDIIAENDEWIVFVEVKTRTSMFGGHMPVEAVDEQKKRFMIASGNAYIKHHEITKSLRFDIVGIVVSNVSGAITKIQHYENAFHPYVRSRTRNSFTSKWRYKK